MNNNDESNYEIKLSTQSLEDIGASKQAAYVEDYLDYEIGITISPEFW